MKRGKPLNVLEWDRVEKREGSIDSKPSKLYKEKKT